MDNLYSSFYLYKKYEIIGDELVDLGITSINADGTQEPVMKEECDVACGCPEPIYRWVQTEDTVCVGEEPAVQYRWTPSGWTCIGYDKYQNNIKEESIDGGITWSVVIPEEYSASTVIEYSSESCGYVPPTPASPKFTLTLNDSSVVSAECDSTSAVTSGEVATQYSGSVVSVEIGDCVTSIDEAAFLVCSNLVNVTIPNTVTSIGNNAFESCSGLTSVVIPSGVTNIGQFAFNNCSSLTSITIPDSVTSIGAFVFQRCTSLTSCTIGSGVTSISSSLFRGCSSLSRITIPNNITSINNNAFSACTSLASVTIPNSVTSIGSSVFQNCSGLTSVTIGNGVTSIGQTAFGNCTSLQSITCLATTPPTLPNSNAFKNTNDCPIYVPSASVSAYQSANNWSYLASRIQAIP